MMAGGIGSGKKAHSKKQAVQKGDKVVILGGDNYRIGMGGGAVSSVDTGEFENAIELNAVQRSNPEMQKRVANAIRALSEMDENLIVSNHDHGAGGHLNCLSELLEETGGVIKVDQLPLGDPTLSEKEIIGNESQERMGLVIKEKDLDLAKSISERERAPFFEVGEATGDQKFVFEGKNGKNPIDWGLSHMFGSSPKTILNDKTSSASFEGFAYDTTQVESYLDQVLQLEAVACKDWLTNKVDRCVTGKVAKQQTTGTIQLPLNNVSVMAIDFKSQKGIATSLGSNPVAALIDEAAGSRLAIAESLTNLIWAPLTYGLEGVSLSANWMWPAKNDGENARLYNAVEAAGKFAIDLGVNIPTGKDSLSMTQKYKDGEKVYAPGTVIISAVGEVSDINKIVEPNVRYVEGSKLIYIDLSLSPKQLGGSALAQVVNKLGNHTADIADPMYFVKAFESIQKLVAEGLLLAGHDISSGGLITTLLEMNFPNEKGGMKIDLSALVEKDFLKALFSENCGAVVQCKNFEDVADELSSNGIRWYPIGEITNTRFLEIRNESNLITLDIDQKRDLWYQSSYQLDQHQSTPIKAKERFDNYKKQPVRYAFPKSFKGQLADYSIDLNRTEATGIKAAIIREKGCNSDREMAYMLWMAGFDVKDVHMTDLISGREDLSDIKMIVFVGGFSNSDVLGSAKGWAGAFLYNEKAKAALDAFYARPDTISLGVCNGCQLMMELGLVFPEMGTEHPRMQHNDSGKFECTFSTVEIPKNNSIMLKGLAGTSLGIWSAHGEGKFDLAGIDIDDQVVAKYSYAQYPANPNGSQDGIAALTSKDGRHLAMMPHLERAMFPWNWPHYERQGDQITPWIEAFIAAKAWVESHT